MFHLLDIKHKLPTSLIISGSTNVGKSKLALEIIDRRSEIFSESVPQCLYVYSEWQDKFEDYSLLHPSVKFTQRYTDEEYY
jgi:hypothetical protein